MTLADISSSNVYVWYSHIQPEKTVEIINRLYSDAAAEIRFSIGCIQMLK